MLSIYSQSTQYIEVPITNSQGINPTGDIVQFAFLGPCATAYQATGLVPTSSTTYHTGSWQSTSPTNGSTYTAIILVGPDNGGVQLSSGGYLVVVRVTDSPEVPVIFSGPLVVS